MSGSPLPDAVDVIVIGSGVAGLSAALFAHLSGLNAIVLERSEFVGGTSALSAGTIWVPMNPVGLAAGHADTANDAARYLDAVVGNAAPRALREAFLAAGPRAIGRLAAEGGIPLRAFQHHPDYLSDRPGARLAGRAIEAAPFDGRLLGADFARLRPPIPEFTVLGGMMVDRRDIADLIAAGRSPGAFVRSARRVGRHVTDRLRHSRGTRLVMGNALVGRLFHALLVRSVPVLTGVAVREIRYEAGRVTGVDTDNGTTMIARRGVVLATGGFNRNPRLRAELGAAATADPSPIAPGESGGAIELALALGAHLTDGGTQEAFLAPVSIHARRDGSTAVFPHFVLDRGKPGTLIVDGQGRRFANETLSYHDFASAMRAAAARGVPAIPAALIADDRAVASYGLGMVRPGKLGLKRLAREGYVASAPTIEALAERLDLPAATLRETIARFGDHARSGTDPDFARGETAYQRNLGDPAHGPNPTMRPLSTPPFHAVRLHPGEIGGSAGLLTDADARVLAEDGVPITGLFAAGNDMASIMGGTYPGPGITLGPAIVFAEIAARALAADDAATGRPRN